MLSPRSQWAGTGLGVMEEACPVTRVIRYQLGQEDLGVCVILTGSGVSPPTASLPPVAFWGGVHNLSDSSSDVKGRGRGRKGGR